MYLQPTSRQPSLYLKPQPMTSLSPAQPPVKRQRSPSPPRGMPLAAVSSAYYRTPPLAAHGPGRLAASSVYGHPSAAASAAPIYAVSRSVRA